MGLHGDRVSFLREGIRNLWKGYLARKEVPKGLREVEPLLIVLDIEARGWSQSLIFRKWTGYGFAFPSDFAGGMGVPGG